jgi:DNA-binding transcriptional LysR family regulator
LAGFSSKYPNARLGLYELEPGPMAQALKNDRLDFGLYYFEIHDPALECRHLGSFSSHVYASRKLLKGRAIPKKIKEVLKLPFIAPRPWGWDPAFPSVDGFPDHKLSRDIRYETELMETHKRFVLEGLAAAVLPDLAVQEAFVKGKVLRLPGPAIQRGVYFFKRINKNLPKAVEFLCEETRKVLRGLKTR